MRQDHIHTRRWLELIYTSYGCLHRYIKAMSVHVSEVIDKRLIKYL